MTETAIDAADRDERAETHPAVGYALVWSAVALWAVNATVSKVVLSSALSTFRLAEVRATGCALVLLLGVAIVRPASLRIRSLRELAFLVVAGVAGLSFVQLLYFVAIERLDIGIALVVNYVAPVVVALWARFVVHEPVRRRLWLAIALALAGLSLVVDLAGGLTLDGVGLLAAFGAAVAYAAYVLMAEAALRGGRDQFSLLAWGFTFSALFWAIAQPWWSFPHGAVNGSAPLGGRLADVSLPVSLLLGYVIVLGTVVPFIALVTALHHVRATRATVLAMLEPVLAAIVAYAWLAEELSDAQIAGALLVLAGTGLAQSARPVPPAHG